MRTVAVFLAGAFAAAASAQSLPNLFPYPNGSGLSETYNTNHKPLDLTGAFFQSLGTNGRSCASCHRPAQGWSISPAELQVRFFLTQGADPIFHNNDGTNCDQHIDTSTIPGRRAASSLLLTRGLIRITMTVPANAEFTVVNVQNPYGCGDMSTLSLYRRPLPATNLKFLTTVMWDGRESSPQTGTQKITNATNPNDLLADLAAQAIGAVTGHQQATAPPTDAQVQDIVNFEASLTTAQAFDYQIGELNADGANGGPVPIGSQQFFVGINDSFPPSFGFNPSGTAFTPEIFRLVRAWQNSTIPVRSSIARGEQIFNTKPITITGVAGLNDTLGLTSVTGTCGTCHDALNVGNHSASVPINIGVGDWTVLWM